MQLYSHQKQMIAKAPKKYGLWWECGVGKTATAIGLADKYNVKTVVVCPKSVKENWEREIVRFSLFPNNFKVITKETFRRDWESLSSEAIIYDECHYVSSPTSQMFKNTLKYINKNKLKYTWLLSATPFRSEPFSIWCYAQLFGYDWNYMRFREKYYYPMRMGRATIWKQRNNIEEDIKRMLESMGQFVEMRDCADIPPQIELQPEIMELNATQKKAIKELDEVLPLPRITAVHRIENETEGEKSARVIELCEEHKKIIIVCRYNAQIELYKSLLELRAKKVFIINGEANNRQEIVDEMNTEDEAILLLQSDTSEGINLSTVPVMVFASMSFSFLKYIQAKGRILRRNNLKKNIYYYLLTSGKSSDRLVYSAIMKGQNLEDYIRDNL